jgi:outer membrane immunogenic protein
MKKLLLSAAAIVAFAAPALAADLPARTYSKAPAVVVDPTSNRSDYNFLPSGAWGGVVLAQLQADGGARLNMANVSGVPRPAIIGRSTSWFSASKQTSNITV